VGHGRGGLRERSCARLRQHRSGELLTAAEEAAEELAAGRLWGAIERLSRGYDGALEWLDDVRATRAEKGGAR